jgi:hypothetical protein
VHKEATQHERTNRITFRILQRPSVLGLFPCRLEKPGILNSRRAGRLARQAAKTKIHLFPEDFARLKPAVCNCAHQRDSTARAVPLDLGSIIGGTGWQTHSAMDALLQERIVQLA